MNVPSEILDRTPPHDIATEQAVLGCMMLDQDRVVEVSALLKPEDFYVDAHQKLYRTMLLEQSEGGGIDTQLLAGRLRHDGNLEAVGGMAYLGELMQSVPVAAHAVYYAKIVAAKARYRAVIHAGTELVRMGYDETADPRDLLNRAEATLATCQTDEHAGMPITARQAASLAMLRVQTVQRTGKSTGILTGLETFDRLAGGLFQGELIILAARTSGGKTALACQIAGHNAAKERGVLIVSLEMSAEELATRMLCGEGDVDSRAIRRAELDQLQVRQLHEAARAWDTRPLWILDRPGVTVQEIARWARRLAKDNLALVVVDYLQLITPTNRRDQRHEQIGQMTAGLKAIARELSVPVLCLAQLSRQADDDTLEPRLSHFRESGSIEQDADMALLLWRKADKKGDPLDGDGIVRLLVKKNRNGPTGFVFLNWRPERTRFGCGETPWPSNHETAFDQFGG